MGINRQLSEDAFCLVNLPLGNINRPDRVHRSIAEFDEVELSKRLVKSPAGIVLVGGFICIEPSTVEVIALGFNIIIDLNKTWIRFVKCRFKFQSDGKTAKHGTLLGYPDQRQSYVSFCMDVDAGTDFPIKQRERVSGKRFGSEKTISYQNGITPPLKVGIGDEIVENGPFHDISVTSYGTRTLARRSKPSDEIRHLLKGFARVLGQSLQRCNYVS